MYVCGKWLSWGASSLSCSPCWGSKIPLGLTCLWPIPAAVLFLQPDFSLSLLPQVADLSGGQLWPNVPCSLVMPWKSPLPTPTMSESG